MTAAGRGLLWLWDHTAGFIVTPFLLALIWVYQRTVSPVLTPSCRFHPSCSRYAWGSIRAHGSGKGLILSVWRLLRCNPWNGGGVDPVPAAGRWLPEIYPDGRIRPGRDSSTEVPGS